MKLVKSIRLTFPLVFFMLSLNMSSVWAQEAPTCSTDEMDDFTNQDPNDDYYYCLRRVCNDLKSQQYDSVRYYLERAMFGNENKFTMSFPNRKLRDLKNFLGGDVFNQKARYDISVDYTASSEPVNSNQPTDASGNNSTSSSESPAATTSENTSAGNTQTEELPAKTDDNETTTLDETTMAELKDKALIKSKKFGQLIGIIADKSTVEDVAQTSILNALDLFLNENSTIGVTSIRQPEAQKPLKVRKYLNRLRMLQYEKVEIKTSDYYMVKEFKKAPDGNYYGWVSFKQRFVGYVKDLPAYEDLTTKSIKVVVRKMQKFENGIPQDFWDVYLVDVLVQETSAN
ncbi:MAG: hypothetical protein U0073_13225 [Bacteroidia bacterium]